MGPALFAVSWFFVKILCFITVFGKFVQLTSSHILETFGLRHSIDGAFLLRYTNFRPIDFFPSYDEKKNILRIICRYF